MFNRGGLNVFKLNSVPFQISIVVVGEVTIEGSGAGKGFRKRRRKSFRFFFPLSGSLRNRFNDFEIRLIGEVVWKETMKLEVTGSKKTSFQCSRLFSGVRSELYETRFVVEGGKKTSFIEERLLEASVKKRLFFYSDIDGSLLCELQKKLTVSGDKRIGNISEFVIDGKRLVPFTENLDFTGRRNIRKIIAALINI